MSISISLLSFAKSVGTIVSETLLQDATSSLINRAKEKRIRTKIDEVTQETLQNVLEDIGGFELDVDEISLSEYLFSPIVVAEIKKILFPKPSVSIIVRQLLPTI